MIYQLRMEQSDWTEFTTMVQRGVQFFAQEIIVQSCMCTLMVQMYASSYCTKYPGIKFEDCLSINI